MNIFSNEKFLVANFKQWGNLQTYENWILEFKDTFKKYTFNTNLVLCPPYPFLDLFRKEIILNKDLNNGKIFLGTQNISSYSNLENTGDISSEMVKDLINFSIIGHSEREENYDEVHKKYEELLKNKIVPIVCFYENKSVYELENCIFAYEDPKAISKEGIFRNKNYDEMVKTVSELDSLFKDTCILYGGSVTKENIQMIKDLEFFSGVLIGRMSQKPLEIREILKVLDN